MVSLGSGGTGVQRLGKGWHGCRGREASFASCARWRCARFQISHLQRRRGGADHLEAGDEVAGERSQRA